MFFVRLIVRFLLTCGLISDVSATVAVNKSSTCSVINGTIREEDHNEAIRHRCILCADTNTTSHFCDNVNQSYDSSFIEWKIDKEYTKSNCENGTDDLNESCCNSKKILGNSANTIWWFWTVFYCIGGILALVGNVTVIITTSQMLKQRLATMSRVEIVQKFLVLNLALSDCLMGVYLFAMGILRLSCSVVNNDVKCCFVRRGATCSALGIINFISNQVSVTLLIIMTSLRLFSVIKPFKKLSTKSAFLCVLICWMVWLFLAFIPVFSMKPITCKVIFSESATKPEYALVGVDWMKKKVLCILDLANQSCERTFKQNNLTQDTLRDILINLNICNNNPSISTINRLDIYNENPWCGMNFFVKIGFTSFYFVMILLTYNFAAFLYIAIAYSYIIFATSRKNCCTKHCCFNFILRCSQQVFCQSREHDFDQVTEREKENRKLYRRISAIILTDFLCWVPMCLLAFWHIGVDTSDQQKMTHHFYVEWFFSVIVVSMNSFINPFVYSDHVRTLLKKCFQKFSLRQ